MPLMASEFFLLQKFSTNINYRNEWQTMLKPTLPNRNEEQKLMVCDKHDEKSFTVFGKEMSRCGRRMFHYLNQLWKDFLSHSLLFMNFLLNNVISIIINMGTHLFTNILEIWKQLVKNKQLNKPNDGKWNVKRNMPKMFGNNLKHCSASLNRSSMFHLVCPNLINGMSLYGLLLWFFPVSQRCSSVSFLLCANDVEFFQRKARANFWLALCLFLVRSNRQPWAKFRIFPTSSFTVHKVNYTGKREINLKHILLATYRCYFFCWPVCIHSAREKFCFHRLDVIRNVNNNHVIGCGHTQKKRFRCISIFQARFKFQIM